MSNPDVKGTGSKRKSENRQNALSTSRTLSSEPRDGRVSDRHGLNHQIGANANQDVGAPSTAQVDGREIKPYHSMTSRKKPPTRGNAVSGRGSNAEPGAVAVAGLRRVPHGAAVPDDDGIIVYNDDSTRSTTISSSIDDRNDEEIAIVAQLAAPAIDREQLRKQIVEELQASLAIAQVNNENPMEAMPFCIMCGCGLSKKAIFFGFLAIILALFASAIGVVVMVASSSATVLENEGINTTEPTAAPSFKLFMPSLSPSSFQLEIEPSVATPAPSQRGIPMDPSAASSVTPTDHPVLTPSPTATATATPTETPTSTPTDYPDPTPSPSLEAKTLSPTVSVETSLSLICDWLETSPTSCPTLERASKGIGQIPSEIGLLTQLKHIQIVRKILTGTIPSEIGLLTQLTHLSFAFNKLEGTIPREIGMLTGVEYLRLFNNSLTGRIPPEIGSMTRLIIMSVSGNQLTGTVPSTLSNLSQLTELYLYANTRLGGRIPETFCSRLDATDLEIDCNNVECSCCVQGTDDEADETTCTR